MTPKENLKELHGYAIDSWNEGTPTRKKLDLTYEEVLTKITYYEQLESDVKRYFYLQSLDLWSNELEKEYKDLRVKLSKVGDK